MSVYSCSDIHGCMWAWNAIKNFLKPEDKLYFLGDSADRGNDGWQIMKELLADPRVIYIRGNHEDLLLDAVGNCQPETFNADDFHWDNAMNTWFLNGGEPTYNAYLKDTERFTVIHQLKNLPFIVCYHNTNDEDVYLTHAGCNVHDINDLTEEEAVWDRHHYLINRWDGSYNEMIVHGHTPIPLMVEQQDAIAAYYSNDDTPRDCDDDMIEPGAYWYAGGHKVNIDCGCVFTDTIVLLNLDTWDEEIFFAEDDNGTK